MVVNMRGEFLTSDVNMNSKRVLNLARTQSACVVPRSFDFACLMFADTIVDSPMLRLILVFSCEIQTIRKFVMTSEPRSPLFPLVSSTLLMESGISAASDSQQGRGCRLQAVERDRTYQ